MTIGAAQAVAGLVLIAVGPDFPAGVRHPVGDPVMALSWYFLNAGFFVGTVGREGEVICEEGVCWCSLPVGLQHIGV